MDNPIESNSNHGINNDRIEAIHQVLDELLSIPSIMIACGNWRDGAISEIFPAGKARLLPGIYSGDFAGIREIQLEDGPHHLHVDLGRIDSLCFTVAPTVCLGFNPTLEIRFVIKNANSHVDPRSAFSLVLSDVYSADGQLKKNTAHAFFEIASRVQRRHPTLVAFDVVEGIRHEVHGQLLKDCIRAALENSQANFLLNEGACVAEQLNDDHSADILAEIVLPLLEDALRLADASLVIYRSKTLIEFKTDRLDGVHRFEEGGYVSWQIGAFDDHHCHLALEEVVAVQFSAEPVPCQGNRINYTVWFLTEADCGNPYKNKGYFSITLNQPYKGESPRLEVINPVFDLYRKYAQNPCVSADELFFRMMRDGASAERITR